MTKTKLYLIGSLRNKRIPVLADAIRVGHPDIEVFDDWYAAGEEADDCWKRYEQDRGRSYQEALSGHAARNVFAFDKGHLDTSTHVLLVLPAGKSGHMEVMYGAYGAKLRPQTAILLDPENVRWDVMYQFVPTVLNSDTEIGPWLERDHIRPAETIRVPDGRWPTRLFPERFGGSSSVVVVGDAAAPPR